MEYTGTKKKILDVSLDLFSKYGYEATSISQIADAVGMKKASLYSHFESKQDIFDSLIKVVTEHYEENSIFAQVDWNNPDEDHSRFKDMTPEEIAESVVRFISFTVHDPEVSRIRKLFTLEQFQNSELSAMAEKRSYQDLMDYHTGLMKYLIANNVLKEGNPELMALQYMAPVSMQIYRMDRNPDCEEEAMRLIEKHTIQFFRQNKKHSEEIINIMST